EIFLTYDVTQSYIFRCVAIATILFKSGSRTRRRDTFFCTAKRKYPKKKPPYAACFLRSAVFIEGCQMGLLPHRQREASMPRPFGLFSMKAPVLGAA
ncbi:MAG: hypothetical protein Q7U43_01650, partial [Methylococcaceae bacterium]|nr:hypothetical protein [Methylococcaceae bacterium]